MGRAPIVVDAGALAPDVATVDALAGMQLAARRLGAEIMLRNATGGLVALIGFAGLDEVLRVEPGREPEEREDPGRVQEEGELGDTAC